MVVGTGRKVGTSTIAQGLLIALKRAGLSVAVGKVGPDIVDTTHHRRISGRLTHSLDLWMLSAEQLNHCLCRLSGGAEFILLEGQSGIFDNYPSDYAVKLEAEVASMLGTPVVLVVDGRGYAESIAALVRGFASYQKNFPIAGVIVNWVRDDAHNKLLRAAIEGQGGVRYLGGVPVGDPMMISGAQVAGAEENPSLLTRNRVMAVGDLVQKAIDLTAIREVAKTATPLPTTKAILAGLPRRCRIAVADDAAFHLTFQDNLDLIRRAGAELVAFSPLADIKLPSDAGGLYLPNAYMTLYAADLEANEAIRTAIREFANAGGAIYAEGGAVAYLCKRLVAPGGEKYTMVGLIPGTATAVNTTNENVETMYCEITAREETVITRIGDKFRGMRESKWLVRLEEKVLNCFQMRDRRVLLDQNQRDTPPAMEGLSPLPHVIATTIVPHWGSNPRMATMFVDAVTASLPTLSSKIRAKDGEKTSS